MLDSLLKPVKNIFLRSIMAVLAMILFMYSGLLFASSMSGQEGAADWTMAFPLLICGGLLLYKVRGAG